MRSIDQFTDIEMHCTLFFHLNLSVQSIPLYAEDLPQSFRRSGSRYRIWASHLIISILATSINPQLSLVVDDIGYGTACSHPDS